MALEKITDAGDIVKWRKRGRGEERREEGRQARSEVVREGKFRCFMHDHMRLWR